MQKCPEKSSKIICSRACSGVNSALGPIYPVAFQGMRYLLKRIQVSKFPRKTILTILLHCNVFERHMSNFFVLCIGRPIEFNGSTSRRIWHVLMCWQQVLTCLGQCLLTPYQIVTSTMRACQRYINVNEPLGLMHTDASNFFFLKSHLYRHHPSKGVHRTE